MKNQSKKNMCQMSDEDRYHMISLIRQVKLIAGYIRLQIDGYDLPDDIDEELGELDVAQYQMNEIMDTVTHDKYMKKARKS